MYFAQHPIYSTMPEGFIGCDVLVAKLTRILFTHIKHNMPTMVNECKDKMKENEQDLFELGPSMPTSQAEKMQLIWQMVLEFLKTYENQIKGKVDARQMAIEARKQGGVAKADIQGGAKIKFYFYKLFSEYDNFSASQEYTDMVIEKAIVNLEGVNISGFPSVDLFVYLLTPQLEKLRDPALDLVQDVYGMLEMMAVAIIEKIFVRFPMLKPEIIEIITNVMQEERNHTLEVVGAIVEAEQNYIFTNDMDFKENKPA
jgi:vacuolar protein sorting-associated protein 1